MNWNPGSSLWKSRWPCIEEEDLEPDDEALDATRIYCPLRHADVPLEMCLDCIHFAGFVYDGGGEIAGGRCVQKSHIRKAPAGPHGAAGHV
jgi:hypothetical protein